MARRRTPAAVEAPIVPRELLEPRNRNVLSQWLDHYGLTRWPERYEAKRRAYAAYGLDANGRDPGDPDPRELLRDLSNDAIPIYTRRGLPARRHEPSRDEGEKGIE